MNELYLYLKSLHIIFIVCWFAGLFYIVRLFVYYAEAQHKKELEKEVLSKQYALMSYRLWYIITWPAAILSTVSGIGIILIVPGFLKEPWMHIKLLFVVLLFLYHLKCQQYVSQMQRGTLNKSSSYFRLWNEGATIILFAVVFLVILKNSLNWIYGVIGLLVFIFMLMLGYMLYKKIRERGEK